MSRSSRSKAVAAFFEPTFGIFPPEKRPDDPVPPPEGEGSSPPDRGDWTQPVKTREGHTVYARPPVTVKFGGTIHTARDKKNLDEQGRDALAQKNRHILSRAIFILSQSPTGRDLLEQMTAAGYRIVFDDDKTTSRGAGGLCDPSAKLLILRSHADAEYLALLIGHEATHAIQNTRHDLFPSTRHKPEVGIKMSFAIEADAYAHQTQIALELAYGDPDGPADQIRMDKPLRQMRGRFPDLVLAAEKIMHDESALANGKTIAAVFEAFYDNYHLRTFYEDIHLDWAEGIAPQYKNNKGHLSRAFNKTTASGFIKDGIQHRGKKYLADHLPSLDFDDVRHSGVSQETADRIGRFYADHMPKTKLSALKIFGVHMKDAARWVVGLTNIAAIVFKKEKPPTSPPPAQKPPSAVKFG